MREAAREPALVPSCRVLVVIADGLRPDVVTPDGMPLLHSLARQYAWAPRARTIRPSVTVPALTSLATGLGPESYRFSSPALGPLAQVGHLRPVLREAAEAGHPTAIVSGERRPEVRRLTSALLAGLSVGTLVFEGAAAPDTARAAVSHLGSNHGGLVAVYLSDCDDAGHAYGWMSRPYLDAAQRVDDAIGFLASRFGADLLLVCSDHGGGGVDPRDHEEPHPLNDRIVLVLAGRTVRRGFALPDPVSILDVPPTVLWALGVLVPPAYEGRILTEAFRAGNAYRELGVHSRTA